MLSKKSLNTPPQHLNYLSFLTKKLSCFLGIMIMCVTPNIASLERQPRRGTACHQDNYQRNQDTSILFKNN